MAEPDSLLSSCTRSSTDTSQSCCLHTTSTIHTHRDCSHVTFFQTTFIPPCFICRLLSAEQVPWSVTRTPTWEKGRGGLVGRSRSFVAVMMFVATFVATCVATLFVMANGQRVTDFACGRSVTTAEWEWEWEWPPSE